MPFRLKIILSTALILGQVQVLNAQSYKENAITNLKKWGIAYCISNTSTDIKMGILSGNAQGAYFELGAHLPEAYEEIKKFINEYAKNPYQGKQYQNLSIQQCLDLIDNENYKRIIKYSDKWIIKE